MSRPKPTVIISTSNMSGKIEQILECEGIYAVFYDGKPFNLKTVASILDKPKYPKMSFAAPGHALGLAAKLNDKFKTNKFTVVRLVAGETITDV